MTDSHDSAVQFSLVQVDEYGPWTVTPEPRRETDLQALQANLYADFAAFVGARDGYAFYGRFDNMVGVTNGVDPAAHAQFQRRVRNQYPVTVSVAIGRGRTPVDALGVASERLQAAGSAQDGDRREALVAGADGVDETTPEHVTVAHFDVVDVTGSYTDEWNAHDVDLAMQRATLELATVLRDEHECFAHFVGGDNVIAVCDGIDQPALDSVIAHVRDRTGLELQVGVGRGPTAHAAGHDAKHALERCRETGTRVQGAEPVSADD